MLPQDSNRLFATVERNRVRTDESCCQPTILGIEQIIPNLLEGFRRILRSSRPEQLQIPVEQAIQE